MVKCVSPPTTSSIARNCNRERTYHPGDRSLHAALVARMMREEEFSSIRLLINVTGDFSLCVDELDVGEGTLPTDGGAGS